MTKKQMSQRDDDRCRIEGGRLKRMDSRLTRMELSDWDRAREAGLDSSSHAASSTPSGPFVVKGPKCANRAIAANFATWSATLRLFKRKDSEYDLNRAEKRSVAENLRLLPKQVRKQSQIVVVICTTL